MKESSVFIVFAKYLYFFGAWPGKYGGKTFLKGTRPLISLVIAVSVITPNVVIGFQRLHSKHAVVSLIKDIMILLHCFNYTVMFTTLYVNKKSLDECLDMLGNFTYFGEPENLEHVQRIARIVVRTMFWGFGIGVVILATLELFDTEVCKMVNSLYGENRMCTVLFPLYIIRGKNKGICLLINILMCGTTWRVVNICCVLGVFQLYTCSLITARFESLIQQISNIDFKKNVARIDLVTCIRHYMYIVRLHLLGKSMFSSVFIPLRYSFILITVLSLTGFIMKPGLMPALFSLSWIFGILLPNYFGQRIIDKSTEVSTALYSSNWYEADVSTQKMLLTFIYLSQRPCRVEIRMLGFLSHQSMKEAFSAFYAWTTFLLKVI